jgi:hypothetical protein
VVVAVVAKVQGVVAIRQLCQSRHRHHRRRNLREQEHWPLTQEKGRASASELSTKSRLLGQIAIHPLREGKPDC